MTKWILQKLLINPNLKNRLVINEMKAFYENFDKVYIIEIKEDIKDDNLLNPKTYTETRMVLNYLNDNSTNNSINSSIRTYLQSIIIIFLFI